MYHKSVLVLSALSVVYGGWVEDLTEKGLDLGGGINLRVDKTVSENSSLLERHVLRMEFSGLGLSLAKIPNQEKLEIGVYYGGVEEGRGKKMGQMIVPILIGFKVIAVGIMMLAGVGGLVLQSLATSKLSLFLSSMLAINKFFWGHSQSKQAVHQPQIKYEQLPPVQYVSYDIPTHSVPGVPEFGSLQAASFDAYANYPSSLHEIADSRAQFTVADAPVINGTEQQVINFGQQPITQNRRQFTKRIFKENPYKTRTGGKYRYYT